MLNDPVEYIQDALQRRDEMDCGTTARKINVTKGSKEEKDFKKTRTVELNGLIKDGPFLLINISKLPSSKLVFGCRFIDELQKVGDQLKRHSWLVAQNYSDHGSTWNASKVPTVQRLLQSVVLSIDILLLQINAYARDITQANIQSYSWL